VKPSITSRAFRSRATRASQAAQARTVALVVLFFVLGAGLAALWFHRRPQLNTSVTGSSLSPTTLAIVEPLPNPVEIRFYSVLAPEAEKLREFSGRIEELLRSYQEAGHGKLILNIRTNADANTAMDDGIKGFNLDQGEGSYLGMALSCGTKKEVLSQLSPEWESALEADISRAIQRVAAAATVVSSRVDNPASNPALAEELQRKMPNLSAMPLEEALRALREDSVKEFTTAVGEMQAEVQQAQARLLQAKAGGSAAEQDAAMRQLQETEKNHAQRLKDLAASAQARVEVLKQLKSGSK
jgi:hypothetical protein